tara:strand:+ start:121 stop:1266 length:1146 start_codon:yes stop_codon:yes gene_type:complete
MGFFDTISDLFSGGSEYTPDGGSSASTPSSNYSYSDLGQSPGAMGGRGPSFGGGDRTPPSPTETTDFVSTPVPTVTPPSSLGFGGSPEGTNIAQDYMNEYLNNLNTLTGGGGGSSDDSPSYVSSGGDPMILNVPSTSDVMTTNYLNEAYGTDTGSDPISVGPGEPSDEMVGLPLINQPPPTPSFVYQQPEVTATQAEAAQNQFDALTSLRNPKTDQDFSFREYIGNIFKTLGSGAKSLGDFISNLSASDALKYFEDFLKGDPNFKGPSPAQQDLFNVPGPGPEVGGGVPSPSGGGDAGGVPQTPAEKVMEKDPCPPGFRLDPILNQCMPIVKSAPTPPPMPTLPQPTTPTGGGIANVYPFTLTPPAGAPIGTVAPIKFTPK